MDDGRLIGGSSTPRLPPERAVEATAYNGNGRRYYADKPSPTASFRRQEGRYATSPVRHASNNQLYTEAGPSIYPARSPNKSVYPSQERLAEPSRGWEMNKNYKTESVSYMREQSTSPLAADRGDAWRRNPIHEKNGEWEAWRDSLDRSHEMNGSGSVWPARRDDLGEAGEEWSDRARWPHHDGLISEHRPRDDKERWPISPPRSYEKRRRSPDPQHGSPPAPTPFRLPITSPYARSDEYATPTQALYAPHDDPSVDDPRFIPRDAVLKSHPSPVEIMRADSRPSPRTPPRLTPRSRHENLFQGDHRFNNSPSRTDRVRGGERWRGPLLSPREPSARRTYKGSSSSNPSSPSKPWNQSRPPSSSFLQDQRGLKIPSPLQSADASNRASVSSSSSFPQTDKTSTSSSPNPLHFKEADNRTPKSGHFNIPQSSNEEGADSGLSHISLDRALPKQNGAPLFVPLSPKGGNLNTLHPKGFLGNKTPILSLATPDAAAPSTVLPRAPLPNGDQKTPLASHPSPAVAGSDGSSDQLVAPLRVDVEMVSADSGPPVDERQLDDIVASDAPSSVPHQDHGVPEEVELVQASASTDALVAEAMDNAELQHTLVAMRSSVIARVAEDERNLDEKIQNLKDRYWTLNERWQRQCQYLDRVLGARRQRLSARPFGTPATPGLSLGFGEESHTVTGRASRRTGNGFFGDAVRSDLEMESIIEKLQIEELQDPSFRAKHTTASIPDMVSVGRGYLENHYDDTNGRVEDPVDFYDVHRVTDTWSADEEAIFVQKYALFPKQFGKISEALESKSPAQCVKFYYLNKRRIDFKAIASKNRAGRPRKGMGRGARGKGKSLLSNIRPAMDEEDEDEVALDAQSAVDEASEAPAGLEDRFGDAQSLGNSSSASPPRVTSSDVVAQPSPANEKRADVSRYPEELRRRKNLDGPTAPSPLTHADPIFVTDRSFLPPLDSEDHSISRKRKLEMTQAGGARRRATTSSYWSVAEKHAVARGHEAHGDDYAAIADEVGTKTFTQVRNFLQSQTPETIAELMGKAKLGKQLSSMSKQPPIIPLSTFSNVETSLALKNPAFAAMGDTSPADGDYRSRDWYAAHGSRDVNVSPTRAPNQSSDARRPPHVLPAFSSFDAQPIKIETDPVVLRRPDPLANARLRISSLLNEETKNSAPDVASAPEVPRRRDDLDDWFGGSRSNEGYGLDTGPPHDRYRQPYVEPLRHGQQHQRDEDSRYPATEYRDGFRGHSVSVYEPHAESLRSSHVSGYRQSSEDLHTVFRAPSVESPYSFSGPSPRPAALHLIVDRQTPYQPPPSSQSRPYEYERASYPSDPYYPDRPVPAPPQWQDTATRPSEGYGRPLIYPPVEYPPRRMSPLAHPPLAYDTFPPSSTDAFRRTSQHVDFVTRRTPSPPPAEYGYRRESPPRFAADYDPQRPPSQDRYYSSRPPPSQFPPEHSREPYYDTQSEYYVRPPPAPPIPWTEEHNRSRYPPERAPEYPSSYRQYGR